MNCTYRLSPVSCIYISAVKHPFYGYHRTINCGITVFGLRLYRNISTETEKNIYQSIYTSRLSPVSCIYISAAAFTPISAYHRTNYCLTSKVQRLNLSTYNDGGTDEQVVKNLYEYHTNWLTCRFKEGEYDDPPGKRDQLIDFFRTFYIARSLRALSIEQNPLDKTPLIKMDVPPESTTTTGSGNLNNETNRYMYTKIAYKKLHDFKIQNLQKLDENNSLLLDFGFGDNTSPLEALQVEIEELTMHFDEASIYREGVKIFELLRKKSEKSCKSTVLEDIYAHIDNLQNISDTEKALLREDANKLVECFGPFSMESIIVYVMSVVYNSVNSTLIVKASSLIQRLEDCAQSQVSPQLSNNLNFELVNMWKKDNDTSSTVSKDSSKEEVHSDSPHSDGISKKKKRKVHNLDNKFQFCLGEALFTYMLKSDLIILESLGIESDDGHILKATTLASKKNGKYFIPKYVYARCNVNLSLLPLKFNLPMICKPANWGRSQRDIKNGRLDSVVFLNQLEGGYLTSSKITFMERFRLLSSSNIHKMMIRFYEDDPESAETLCYLMNSLQSQPFQINTPYLKLICSEREEFVKNGLLLPDFLSKSDQHDIVEHLRTFYCGSTASGYKPPATIKYDEVMSIMYIDLQRASFERNMLELATAYNGYKFYLPAFLDFRGRIYRSGVLHFHERDIARSLILFAADEINDLKCPPSAFDCPKDIFELSYLTYIYASAYHYKSFPSDELAIRWLFKKDIIRISNNKMIHPNTEEAPPLKSILSWAKDAKRPFQFVGTMFGISQMNMDVILRSPIIHDASASAYQIMSFLTLDLNLAENTNLRPVPRGSEVRDVYIHLQEGLLRTLALRMENHLKKGNVLESRTAMLNRRLQSKRRSMKGESPYAYPSETLQIFRQILDRKTVKSLFMPMLYGKKPFTAATDLENKIKCKKPQVYGTTELDNQIVELDCWDIVHECYQYLNTAFPAMSCLIQLIQLIGGLVSSKNVPVYYCADYMITLQQYKMADRHNFYVYDPKLKKKRKVSLQVPSKMPNPRKSSTSTFVNVIHQMDANIAMNIIHILSTEAPQRVPLYTVHDNFLVAPYYSDIIIKCYNLMFSDRLQSPLSKILHFIYVNIIMPYSSAKSPHKFKNTDIIPTETLKTYLDKFIPNDKKAVQKPYIVKIKKIVEAYELYITLMCGSSLNSDGSNKDELYQSHLKKFHDFQNSLRIPEKSKKDLRYHGLHY